MKTSNYDNKQTISSHELAVMGGGQMAYIREINAEKAIEIMGQLPDLPSNVLLYALYAADGTCMAITDSHDDAQINAWERGLDTASVH